MTVLLFGYEHDPMVEAVQTSLDRIEADTVNWTPRQLLNDCAIELNRLDLEGMVLVGDRMVDLAAVTGIFNRQSNVELAPEFRALDPADPVAQHAVAASARASMLCDLAPCPVLNRNDANNSNSSKPLQSLLISEYFDVPRTCVTNDYETAAAFHDEVGAVIFKSCSGERSIVSDLVQGQLEEKRTALAACPVQFQEKVDGHDMRVHVVGEATFATEIRSDGSDYRYDRDAVWKAAEIGDDVAEAAVAITRKLGLVLSGVDLRFSPDGRVYCFEVNPSPAFAPYQDATGQRISDEIALLLSGR